MIKVIAFDLVGVLVTERDIDLTEEEDKLERMFGSNINDSNYLMKARKIIDNDSTLIRTTEEIINKLYKVKDENLFRKIKETYHNIKIVIATNHVSFVRNFISETLGVDYLDDIFISAEIHKVKPNQDFYHHILNKLSLQPEELLFLDDNIDNIDGAKNLGINTIKINKETDLYNEIIKFLDTDSKKKLVN